MNVTGLQQQYKKAQQFSINEDGLLGKVWIGNTSQLYLCLVTLPWPSQADWARKTKLPSGTPHLVDTDAINNLPQRFFVNHCLAHPKGNAVLVIIMSQIITMLRSGNCCLQQKFFGWNISHGIMGQNSINGEKIEVAFQPLPTADIMASVQVVHDGPGKMPSVNEEAN